MSYTAHGAEPVGPIRRTYAGSRPPSLAVPPLHPSIEAQRKAKRRIGVPAAALVQPAPVVPVAAQAAPSGPPCPKCAQPSHPLQTASYPQVIGRRMPKHQCFDCGLKF
ncbi:MAG: hypothetical protein AMXMBFR7_16250 [Planctomycetota bacterium]